MTEMTETLHPAQTVRGRTHAQVRKHDWLKSIVLLGLVANALFFCGRVVQLPPAVPPLTAPVVQPAVAVQVAPAVSVVPIAAKLYFDTAKFDLKADADQTLKAIIDYAKANPTVKLTVSGFHDKQGNADANAELAKNRAKVVAAKMNELGIMEARVFLEKPQEVLGGANDQEARRVEVAISK
jgi:outer membrane protein OmpA-like peptidoglycan-associated protein